MRRMSAFLCLIMLAISTKSVLMNSIVGLCKPVSVCSVDRNDSIDCLGFESFAQMDPFGCGVKDKEYFTSAKRADLLTIYPDRPLILDKSLNISGLLELVFGFTNYDMPYVRYFNLAGLDLNLLDEPVPEVRNYTIYYYEFNQIRLNFYLNGKQLDMSCKNLEWLNMYNYSSNVLSLIPAQVLKLAGSYFPSNMCPSVFHLTTLDSLTIHGRVIEFDTKNYSFLSQIRTSIKYYVWKDAYKVDLTNRTLPASVFQNLTQFQLRSDSISKIQTKVFKNLNRLRVVVLKLINLRGFFHDNQINWIYYLNLRYRRENFSEANSSDEISYILKYCVGLEIHYHINDNDLYPVDFFPYFEYQFPDVDFCLFSSFPHENLIVPELYNKDRPNCSCTLKWILKYIPFYQKISEHRFNSDNYLSYDNCTNPGISCDIEARRNSCLISPPVDDYKQHYFDFYDLKNQIHDLKIVVRDILGPIFSFVAIITNLLTILTIRLSPKIKQGSKTSRLDDNLLYGYMKWNAGLNLACSIIYFLFYSIKCKLEYVLDGGLTPDTCFKEEIYVNTVTSCLKLMANFSFLQMCLNRFVLVSQNDQRLFSLAQCPPRKFVFITLVVSSLLSVIIYFKEQTFGSQTPFDGLVLDEEFYYNEYYWYWYGNEAMRIREKIVLDKLAELPLISAFMLIHDFFSYLFFCVASTIIDALTVKNLRELLKEKRKKTAVDHDEELTRTEVKSIIMIVLSSCFNFILRFPELFSTVFLYVLLFNKNSHYTFKMLCYSYRECLPIVEIANVFFILSLSLNFIFYLMFDKNFKNSFWHLFNKCFAIFFHFQQTEAR